MNAFQTHQRYTLDREQHVRVTGTILTKKYVLTSAQMFQDMVNSWKKSGRPLVVKRTYQSPWLDRLFIRAGINKAWAPGPNMQERLAKRFIVHEDYQRPSTMFDVDLALIEVRRPFDFSTGFVKPIRLSSMLQTGDRRTCEVIGFGYRSINETYLQSGASDYQMHLDLGSRFPLYNWSHHGPRLNWLRYMHVLVGDSAYCTQLHVEMDRRGVTFSDSIICGRARYLSKPTAPCIGDNGAPLVCNGLLTGVFAGNHEKTPCDSKNGGFGYYTSTADYYEWFRRYIKGLRMPVKLPLNNGTFALNPYDNNVQNPVNKNTNRNI